MSQPDTSRSAVERLTLYPGAWIDIWFRPWYNPFINYNLTRCA